MTKTYVLDTNVLLTDPRAIYAFQENDLVIPLVVLEELDRHKSRQDEVGRNARHTNSDLDKLRQQGSLIKGVTLPGGGHLRVAMMTDEATKKLPVELDSTKADNMIIAFMLQNPTMVLVSKDINVRVKCDSLGVEAQDYLNSRPAESPDKFYRGVSVIDVPAIDVEKFYASGSLTLADDSNLHPNQIVVVKSEAHKSALTRFTTRGQPLRPIIAVDDAFGLKPRNKEQRFAFDLLFDDSIKLVTLVGPAGTGKTLLALAAGLEQMKGLGRDGTQRFTKMIVSRPIQTVGNDIGFLPGTLKEKMDPWIAPIRDNLNYLMGSGKRPPGSRRRRGEVSDEPYLEMLQEQGVIEIEALAYIRGRSIPDAYMVIDEAQNLSVHELKTIITRCGDNTKIVLTGDIEQIDNSHLDIFTNGLTHAVERFKDHGIAGHVTLIKGERSDLATLASKIL